MQPKIIQQLQKANLTGRGGASFPTWKKWEAVLSAPGKEKYVVCNLSEGEPAVYKDKFVIENFAKEFIDGMEIAINTIKAKNGYIYCNPEYYKEYKAKLQKLIGKLPIEIFNKGEVAGYIGGEESSLLENIEGKRVEPRLRPPFPVSYGLFGQPTLVNNCETFYEVALISSGKYKDKRLYSLSGDINNPGVFELLENNTIKKILQETNNLPKFDFFVQVGGGISGQALNQNQLEQPVGGAGSIVVYNRKKTKGIDLIKKWIEFYSIQSCGKCVPCREGTFRLKEELAKQKPDWGLIVELCHCLEDSAFCALGASVATPILSYIKNINNLT